MTLHAAIIISYRTSYYLLPYATTLLLHTVRTSCGIANYCKHCMPDFHSSQQTNEATNPSPSSCALLPPSLSARPPFSSTSVIIIVVVVVAQCFWCCRVSLHPARADTASSKQLALPWPAGHARHRSNLPSIRYSSFHSSGNIPAPPT